MIQRRRTDIHPRPLGRAAVKAKCLQLEATTQDTHWIPWNRLLSTFTYLRYRRHLAQVQILNESRPTTFGRMLRLRCQNAVTLLRPSTALKSPLWLTRASMRLFCDHYANWMCVIYSFHVISTLSDQNVLVRGTSTP